MYIDTRYNDKIPYEKILTGTKSSLKRWQQIKNYARTLYLIFPGICVLYICKNRLSEAILTIIQNICFDKK